MFKPKQLLVFILAASSSLAFADNTSRHMHSNTCACQQSWNLGIQALYVKPSYGGNGLGYTTFSNQGNDIFGNILDVNGAPNNMSNMNPQRNWGFRLDGGYHVDAMNDISVNWSHFNETTTGYLPFGTLFAGSASGLYAGYIKVAPRWDAVNLEAGHNFKLDCNKSLRLHAGLAYANIQNKFTNFPQLFPASGVLFTTTDKMNYWGVGPRFGADFDYAMDYGLGIYAKAAGSLLVGNAKQSVMGYNDIVIGTTTFRYTTGNYDQSHNNVVVPEIEAKLGLTYEYQFNQGTLGLDLGYMWMSYLNAIVSQVGADVDSSAISASTTTNFDLNGLYFGISWSGNV